MPPQIPCATLFALLALLGAARPWSAIPLPDRQERQEESDLDKMLRVARTGRTVVRPQAARRIVRLWSGSSDGEREAIVERLLDECGADTASLARLGSALIEVLGQFDDRSLRERLWTAIDDPDFPWRPYAARALATTAEGGEAERLETLLVDPIAPVRAAAIEALRTLERRGAIERVRERLADENDRVRRVAADLLADWGEARALWWLLEDLEREDAFFDRPTGRQARYQSLRLLARHLGDTAGYDPDAPVADPANRRAMEAMAGAIEERGGERPSLPPVARAGPAVADEVLGMELRSCRRGEYFMRWTRGDELLVGQGNPARLPLPEGTVARLYRTGRERTAEVAERRFYGAPGCDLEQLHWRPEAQGEATAWIISKGPEVVENLRPAALNALYAELVATLPDEPSDDPRIDRLGSRVRAALAVLGGPLDGEGH